MMEVIILIYFANVLYHDDYWLLLLTIHWPLQAPIDWRYLPYIRPIFQAQISGDIPPIHMARNMVRLRTSINWILEFPFKWENNVDDDDEDEDEEEFQRRSGGQIWNFMFENFSESTLKYLKQDNRIDLGRSGL